MLHLVHVGIADKKNQHHKDDDHKQRSVGHKSDEDALDDDNSQSAIV